MLVVILHDRVTQVLMRRSIQLDSIRRPASVRGVRVAEWVGGALEHLTWQLVVTWWSAALQSFAV